MKNKVLLLLVLILTACAASVAGNRNEVFISDPVMAPEPELPDDQCVIAKVFNFGSQWDITNTETFIPCFAPPSWGEGTTSVTLWVDSISEDSMNLGVMILGPKSMKGVVEVKPNEELILASTDDYYLTFEWTRDNERHVLVFVSGFWELGVREHDR